MTKALMKPGEAYHYPHEPVELNGKKFHLVFCLREMHGSPYEFLVSGRATDDNSYEEFIVVFDPYTKKIRKTAQFIGHNGSYLRLVS